MYHGIRRFIQIARVFMDIGFTEIDRHRDAAIIIAQPCFCLCIRINTTESEMVPLTPRLGNT